MSNCYGDWGVGTDHRVFSTRSSPAMPRPRPHAFANAAAQAKLGKAADGVVDQIAGFEGSQCPRN